MEIITSFKVFSSWELRGQTTEEEVNLCQEEDGSLFGILPIHDLDINIKSISLTGIPNFKPEIYSYILRPSTGRVLFDVLALATGLKLTFPKLELNTHNTLNHDEYVNLRFYLTNLPFFQSQNQQYKVKILNYDLSFSKYTKGCISTVVEIDNIKYGDIGEIEKIVDDVCWICSFAGEVSCSIARLEAYHNNDIVYVKMNNCKERNKFNSGSPVIDDSDICKFIDNSYQYYQKCQKDYLLNNLIDIGLVAKHTIFIEAKLLLMSNFLEVIRFRYGCKLNREQGDFKKLGKKFVWRNRPKKSDGNYQEATFREILENFCHENLISSSWNIDFVSIRNEIVHTGNIVILKAERYKKLHHCCNRVILALLNWDQVGGEYISRGSVTKEPFKR